MSDKMKTYIIGMFIVMAAISFIISIAIRKIRYRAIDSDDYDGARKKIYLLSSIALVSLLCMVILSLYVIMSYLLK